MSKKILIVEDDASISRLIEYNLEKAGYKPKVCDNGEKALEVILRNQYDMILLDIMLPGIDGLEVCRKIRQSSSNKNIPIIMVTAKGEEIDKIVGFELGVDDYMVKPFSPRELILRVKAIFKRTTENIEEKELLQIGKITIDIPKHIVTVEEQEIDLTPMEFNLLYTLMSRKGRVQSRDRLLSDVWDIAADVNTRTIDTHIKRLRKKLGSAGDYVETIRGMGYKLKEKS